MPPNPGHIRASKKPRAIHLGFGRSEPQRHPLLEPTLAALEQRGPLIDVGTLHLDRGYDFPKIRRQLHDRGLAELDIQKRGTKPKPGQPHRLTLGLRWIVEAANSWLSSYGQLRRSTDRSKQHRHAAMCLATTVQITARLINSRNRWSPNHLPNQAAPYLNARVGRGEGIDEGEARRAFRIPVAARVNLHIDVRVIVPDDAGSSAHTRFTLVVGGPDHATLASLDDGHNTQLLLIGCSGLRAGPKHDYLFFQRNRRGHPTQTPELIKQLEPVAGDVADQRRFAVDHRPTTN